MSNETININDIKKGDVVIFKDGSPHTVADNKRGLVRDLFVDLYPHADYAFKWKYALISGVELRIVTMTVAQMEQAQIIKEALDELPLS